MYKISLTFHPFLAKIKHILRIYTIQHLQTIFSCHNADVIYSASQNLVITMRRSVLFKIIRKKNLYNQ